MRSNIKPGERSVPRGSELIARDSPTREIVLYVAHIKNKQAAWRSLIPLATHVSYFGICETLAFVRPLCVGEAQNASMHKLVVVVVVISRRAYLEFLFTLRIPVGAEQTLSSPTVSARTIMLQDIQMNLYGECVFAHKKCTRRRRLSRGRATHG